MLSWRLALVGILLAVSATLDAAEKPKPWYKYENSFFEVYSDVSERKVRRLLDDLECFRAAIILLDGSSVPEGSPRTRVIIFGDDGIFRQTIGFESIDGYTVGIEGVPHIVMAAPKVSDWSKVTIRHEFAHVLQGYSGDDVPQWYFEGRPEFLSGVTFGRKNTGYAFGGIPKRQTAVEHFVEWDALVADGFSFSAVETSQQASNAYFQASLLVRHLVLERKDELGEYLALYAQGVSSSEAFVSVFGESAGEMGPRIYAQYERDEFDDMQQFLPDLRDRAFEQTLVGSETVAALVDELKRTNDGR
ncbi:MAG: hypothetical protein KJO09_07360 [Gammaproteobacteria bacterium]|nr:hypothetical protein [Gammaproteobacteria bacterium]